MAVVPCGDDDRVGGGVGEDLVRVRRRKREAETLRGLPGGWPPGRGHAAQQHPRAAKPWQQHTTGKAAGPDEGDGGRASQGHGGVDQLSAADWRGGVGIGEH